MFTARRCSPPRIWRRTARSRRKCSITRRRSPAPSETPPTDSKGTGTLTATFDTDTKKLEWTADYSGLTGPAIAAHFHGPAPVGKAAPIEVPLKPPLDSPMKGSATLTDAQAKDLMDGMMYFNIHTAANKPGEIRGQMEKAM